MVQTGSSSHFSFRSILKSRCEEEGIYDCLKDYGYAFAHQTLPLKFKEYKTARAWIMKEMEFDPIFTSFGRVLNKTSFKVNQIAITAQHLITLPTYSTRRLLCSHNYLQC